MPDARDIERDEELQDIIDAQKKITTALKKISDEDPDRPLTFGEKAADAIVKFVGSWKFIILQAALLAAWLAFNISALLSPDIITAKSIILTNFVLSVEAAFAAPLILIAQNRAAVKDRNRAIDAYKTVLHIEELMKDLHRKIKAKNGNGAKKSK